MLVKISSTFTEVAVMCDKDDKRPMTMHQPKDKGSMAYGTNMINSMYHTWFSGAWKPIPWPLKPGKLFDIQE